MPLLRKYMSAEVSMQKTYGAPKSSRAEMNGYGGYSKDSNLCCQNRMEALCDTIANI